MAAREVAGFRWSPSRVTTLEKAAGPNHTSGGRFFFWADANANLLNAVAAPQAPDPLPFFGLISFMPRSSCPRASAIHSPV